MRPGHKSTHQRGRTHANKQMAPLENWGVSSAQDILWALPEDGLIALCAFRPSVARTSCGLEEGFDPLSQVQAVFKAIPNRQLIEEHRTQHKTLSIRFAFGWDLAMSLKDAFELFVPVLDG